MGSSGPAGVACPPGIPGKGTPTSSGSARPRAPGAGSRCRRCRRRGDPRGRPWRCPGETPRQAGPPSPPASPAQPRHKPPGPPSHSDSPGAPSPCPPCPPGHPRGDPPAVTPPARRSPPCRTCGRDPLPALPLLYGRGRRLRMPGAPLRAGAAPPPWRAPGALPPPPPPPLAGWRARDRECAPPGQRGAGAGVGAWGGCVGCVYVRGAGVQRCVCTPVGCTPTGVLAPGDAHARVQRGYELGLWGGCGTGDVPVGLQMCEHRGAGEA